MSKQVRLFIGGALCAVILLTWLAWEAIGQPVVFSPGSGGGGNGGTVVAGVSSWNLRSGAVSLAKGDVTALGTLDNNIAGNAATATGCTNDTFQISAQTGVAATLQFLSGGGVDNWSLIINNHSNLLTGLSFVGRNFLVTPVSVTYAATVALNFNAAGNQWIVLGGDITITSLNLAAGRAITVRFDAGAADRAIVLPAWHFLAGAQNMTLGANKSGILSVVAYDGTDANCIATWASE
jgi:hypothetical protein